MGMILPFKTLFLYSIWGRKKNSANLFREDFELLPPLFHIIFSFLFFSFFNFFLRERVCGIN
jgi:hypothetical protein